MSAASSSSSSSSSSAEAPYGATHKDPRSYYWKNESNGSGGEGTWYIYNSRSRMWDQAQKPGDLTPISGANEADEDDDDEADEDDDDEDEEDGAGAAAAPAPGAEAGAGEYRGEDEEDKEQQEEYDEDEDAPIEGEDTFEDGPDWEYGQRRHEYTDSLGLSDADGRALYAAMGDEDFSEAFADALAYIGVQNPDDDEAEAAVEGGEINDYGKIVASAFGAGVESVISSPGSQAAPPSAPRSASAPAPAAPYESTMEAVASQTFAFGTQEGPAEPAPPSPSAAASSSSSSSSSADAASPPVRSARARRPPPVFSPAGARARRQGRVAEPSNDGAAAAGASASPPSVARAPSLASSAVRTVGSEVSAATKRTVLHRSQVEQTRLDTTNPDRWGSKSTSVDEFKKKMRLDEVCILCSCKFRERLSGNKVSGKKNLANLKKLTDDVLETFKGISLDHHLPVNFLCALVGGITAKGLYTAGQYNIFALTGDLVCWNCNYVKNDALFATLRRSQDGTFAGLKVSKAGIKGFCEKLWANENKEGVPFLPADVADAKRLGAKNTLQLAVLRKMKKNTTPAQAKVAWMAHQIPILEDRTQLLLNQIRQYAWPRRAINRLKALGSAKRAQDKITETLPAYQAAKSEFDRLSDRIKQLKGGDKAQLKVVKDQASALRTTMNKLKISNGTQRVLAVLAKLDELKPVWLPDTPPTQGAKTQAGGATFVPGVEFPGAAAARPRVPEATPAAVEVINAAKAASRRAAPAAAAAAALATIQEDEDEDDGVVREGSLQPVPEEEAAASALDTSLSNVAPPSKRRSGGGFNARVWNQLQQEQHQAGSARQTRRRRGHRGTRRRRRYAEARS